MWIPLVLELLVCAIHPLPRMVRRNVDSTLLHRQLGLLMFARVYLVGRILRNNSDVYRNRHR